MSEAPIYTNGGTDPAEHERRRLIEQMNADRLLLAKRRADRQAAHDATDEVMQAKIALDNEMAIDAAEAEHGPIEGSTKIAAVYSVSGRVVIVKRPHRAHFHRFQDAKGDVTTKRVHELVAPYLINPTAAEFDSWLNEEPALLGRVAHQLSLLAGIRNEELGKK